jgi:hypothetical protein
VLDSKVDAALLQEASVPPYELNAEFMLDRVGNWSESGHSWSAAVVGVVKSDQVELIPIKTQLLGGSDPEALMVSRLGSLAAAVMRIKAAEEEITVVSMYANWMNPIRLDLCRCLGTPSYIRFEWSYRPAEKA